MKKKNKQRRIRKHLMFFTLNLEELLIQGIPELVEVMKGGAPCAWTLRNIVLSKRCAKVDIEALQVALSQAMVTLG